MGLAICPEVREAAVIGTPHDHLRSPSPPTSTPRHVPGVPTTTASGRGYLYQLSATAGWTSLPLLPRTRQPTLIVAGTDDPLIPVANAKLMHLLLPHAALHLQSGGHLALASEADALAHEITSFLDAPDDPPPKVPAAPAPQPKRSRLAVTARRSVGTAARVLRSGVSRFRSIL